MPHDTNDDRMCNACYNLFEKSTHLIINAHENEIRGIKMKFDSMIKKINDKISQKSEEKNTIIDMILDDYMDLFPEEGPSVDKKGDESVEVVTIAEEEEESLPEFYTTYDEGISQEDSVLKQREDPCCSFVENKGLSPIPELGDVVDVNLENITFGKNKLIEVPVIDIKKLNEEMPEVCMKKKMKRVRKLNRSKSHFEFGKVNEDVETVVGGREREKCSSMDKNKKKKKERSRVLRIKKKKNRDRKKVFEPKRTNVVKNKAKEVKRPKELKKKNKKKCPEIENGDKKPDPMQEKENKNVHRGKKGKKKVIMVNQGKRKKPNQKPINKLQSVYRTRKTILNADRFERKQNSRVEKKSVSKNLFKDCYSNNNDSKDHTISVLTHKRSMRSISDITVTLKNNLIVEQSFEEDDIEFVETGNNLSIPAEIN